MCKALWSLDAGRCLGRLCLFALLVAAAMLLAAPGEAAEKQLKKNPTLEEALTANLPKIIDFLWGNTQHPKGELHVGVLKFLVQTGGNPPSDNAGPLNLHMARRLEAALILALGEKTKVRVLHNPSAQVMGKANQLSEDGRKAFFQKDYLPAWARDPEKKVPAHVFLTGLVKMADGARSLEVTVQAFDRTGKAPVDVCRFQVAAEPRLLTEAGVSFALSRGGNPEDIAKMLTAWKGPELPPRAITSVPPNKGGAGANAKEVATVRELLEQAPVGFQVLYNGKAQDVGPDGRVREPDVKDEVTFHLWHKKRDKDQCTYGVVLKINGENTIYPEEWEPNDFRAHKWVLSPKDDYILRGYLTKDGKDEAKAFKVKSASESRLDEMNYGPHAGTFTIVLFQGRTDGKDQPPGKEAEVVRAIAGISRGVPDKLWKQITLQALQGDLLRQADKGEKGLPRGLIEAGDPTKQEVKDVEFHAYPKPVSVIQLRYYKPHSQE